MIRVNLLGADRPTKKIEAEGGGVDAVRPGRRAGLPLPGAVRRRRRSCSARRSTGTSPRRSRGLDTDDRRRPAAPAGAAGHQGAGGRPGGQARHLPAQGGPHRAAEGRAVRARCTCWTRSPRRCPTSSGSPRWSRRATSQAHRPEQRADLGGRLHQRAAAQRLVPGRGPRLQHGGQQHRHLRAAGHASRTRRSRPKQAAAAPAAAHPRRHGRRRRPGAEG